MGNFSENFKKYIHETWKDFEKLRNNFRIQLLNYLIYKMRKKLQKNFGTHKLNFIWIYEKTLKSIMQKFRKFGLCNYIFKEDY